MWLDLNRPSWPRRRKIVKGVGSTPSLWLQKESQIKLIIKWRSIVWPPEVHPHWLNSRCIQCRLEYQKLSNICVTCNYFYQACLKCMQEEGRLQKGGAYLFWNATITSSWPFPWPISLLTSQKLSVFSSTLYNIQWGFVIAVLLC